MELGAILGEALQRHIQKIPMHKSAEHSIYTNGCVKLPYKEYVISISSDGYDVIIEHEDTHTLYQVVCHGKGIVDAIVECKTVIDNAKNKE